MEFKGKGKHSVNQLEEIIDYLLEKQHQVNSRQFFTRSDVIRFMSVALYSGISSEEMKSVEEFQKDVDNYTDCAELSKSYLDKFYPTI